MNNLPMWAPVFQFNTTTFQLEYKPFPKYYQWRQVWNLEELIMLLVQGIALLLLPEVDNKITANNATYELDTMAGRVSGLEGQTAQLFTDLAATDAVANQGVTDAATAYGVAEQALSLAQDAIAGQGTANTRQTMWHDESLFLAGSPAIALSSTYQYNWLRYTVTNGAEFTQSFTANVASAANLWFFGNVGTNCGKLDVYIDSTFVGTVDFYAAVNNPNSIKALRLDFTGLTNGYHKLRCVVNGKDAASSGYAMSLVKMAIVPDGD